ncbi:MAG: lysophospholipid acyltransferase family protein, partial [Pseudomonadota bacterium]
MFSSPEWSDKVARAGATVSGAVTSASRYGFSSSRMIRVVVILLILVPLTLVLLPFQLAGIIFNSRLQRTIPHIYHRILCAVIGIRIREIGERSNDSPVLILANHSSWMDICIISAVAPVVFVAKHEIAGWPVFGWLAKLQRSIFIDRQARHRTGAATQEIAERMLGGDA